MSVKLYKVGGCVRDNVLGKKPKDIDLAAEASSWGELLDWCHQKMDKVYLVKPEFLTIKGRLDGIDMDVVMCRKESFYTDQRHPDKVLPGTLLDDLSRRDFTINALAQPYGDASSEIIDFFGGLSDIKEQNIKCVGSTNERFHEDPLRILRAARFAITLDFNVDINISDYFLNKDAVGNIVKTVSQDRIREELTKCFKFDTYKTLKFLSYFPNFISLFEDENLWLVPTTKSK